MSTLLPVAGPARVRTETVALLRQNRGKVALTAGLHALAAITSLAGPALLGHLVDDVVSGDVTASSVDQVVAVLAAALLLQAGLTCLAFRSSLLLAEQVLAQLREQFIERVTGLPLSAVERAGGGDLISRTTNDIGSIGFAVRYASPHMITAMVSLVVTAVALAFAGPLIAVAALIAVPLLWLSTRWYLRRAGTAYQQEMAAYAALNGTIGETTDGTATVIALSLQDYRRAETDRRLVDVFRYERRTLWLRCRWFPICELGYSLMILSVLGWGGWLVLHGHASAGQVTAVTLYITQLIAPMDQVLMRLNEFQVGATSLARIFGVGLVPDDRQEGSQRPDSGQITATGVRYAYREGRDVLHDVDLRLRPGERLAVVGPSGAGKSTLGRLLAGIHPPGSGTVTAGSPAGAVPLVELPLDELRANVALVTQEQHVFVGTVAQNLRLASPSATDEQLHAALESVDAGDWARTLPDGLETKVGSGGYPVPPSWAQQLALARLVLADPHTLVLDEATSLLDPRAARHLERSLSSVLAGRTVVAVAHRLNTAHDADRVAVVEQGRISELGTHDELIERDGSYAALWRAWRHEGDLSPRA